MRAFGINGWPEVRDKFLVHGPFGNDADLAMLEGWERQHAKYGTATSRIRNLYHRNLIGLYRDGVEAVGDAAAEEESNAA
jgi:hypothetical protein